MAKKSKYKIHQDILSEINKSVSAAYGWFECNLKTFKRDKEFIFLKQWTDEEADEFRRLRKPRMTVNKIYDYYKKIVSEQRSLTPNLQVRCLTGNSDQQAIEIREKIVRQIAYGSRSNIVYQTAFENMLSGGFGAIRVVIDYENPKSFNQHAFLRRVTQPERCFFDPDAKEPTKRDGHFCGYYDTMSIKEFKNKYPSIKDAGSFPPAPNYDSSFNWGDKDNITLVEYWKKEYFSFTLYQLSDGRKVTKKEYEKIVKKYEEMLEMEDLAAIQEPIMLPEIVAERKSKDYKIKYYKVIHNHVLEEQEYPSKEFPLIFCPGDSQVVDGKERTLSFVRHVIDAQRMFNLVASEIAQAVKNNRREQFLATPANVSGEAIIGMWKNSSIQQGVLLANPDPITGQMPIKLPEPEIPQSLVALSNNLEKDIRTGLGFYESNLGTPGQQVSGVAIQERQKAGSQSFGVFFDNLERAVEQAGRVIMSLLPRIYDTERTVKGQDFNGDVKDIKVNQPMINGGVQNSLKDGEYDIVIEAGPSFAVQRENAMQTMLELVKIGGPQTYTMLADLLAENTDLENTPQIVERLQNIVPPEILAKEKGQPPPPPQPNPQVELEKQKLQNESMKLQLQAKELMANNQKAELDRQIDAAKIQAQFAEIEEKRQAAGIRAQTEMEKAQLEKEATTIDSLAKIVKAHSDINKSHHDIYKSFIQ